MFRRTGLSANRLALLAALVTLALALAGCGHSSGY